MDQVIVYLLTNMGNLGCFPECVVVDTDDKGVFSTHFVKVSNQNISNYQHLFDETDKILFNYCLKLEKDVIVSKIKDKTAKTWEDLEKKFFKSKKLNTDTQYIKDYLVDYIEINQNDFFEHLSDLFSKGSVVSSCEIVGNHSIMNLVSICELVHKSTKV